MLTVNALELMFPFASQYRFHMFASDSVTNEHADRREIGLNNDPTTRS